MAALAIAAALGGPLSAQYYVAPARVVYPAPVVTYSSPAVLYSSPVVTTTYASPAPIVVSTPAPVVSYSYYQPPTTVYSAPAVVSPPTVVYSAPATVVQTPAPGVYTTRTYTGFGIFRPRGTYTETYYSPYLLDP
jgi:hypothetical protein